MPDSFMVSGVFGMFFIHRKRTASLPLSETAPFISFCSDYLMISMSRDSTTKIAAAIFVPRASLASKVLALDLLK